MYLYLKKGVTALRLAEIAHGAGDFGCNAPCNRRLQALQGQAGQSARRCTAAQGGVGWRGTSFPVPVACDKQAPVVALLREALVTALAHADAIRDNAQDDRLPISSGLIDTVQTDCLAILSSLHEAHTLNH